MQFYTENEKKNKNLQFYYQLLTSTHNIPFYKNCAYCKHKTSLVRRIVSFMEQYYVFRNEL